MSGHRRLASFVDPSPSVVELPNATMAAPRGGRDDVETGEEGPRVNRLRHREGGLGGEVSSAGGEIVRLLRQGVRRRGDRRLIEEETDGEFAEGRHREIDWVGHHRRSCRNRRRCLPLKRQGPIRCRLGVCGRGPPGDACTVDRQRPIAIRIRQPDPQRLPADAGAHDQANRSGAGRSVPPPVWPAGPPSTRSRSSAPPPDSLARSQRPVEPLRRARRSWKPATANDAPSCDLRDDRRRPVCHHPTFGAGVRSTGKSRSRVRRHVVTRRRQTTRGGRGDVSAGKHDGRRAIFGRIEGACRGDDERRAGAGARPPGGGTAAGIVEGDCRRTSAVTCAPCSAGSRPMGCQSIGTGGPTVPSRTPTRPSSTRGGPAGPTGAHGPSPQRVRATARGIAVCRSSSRR